MNIRIDTNKKMFSLNDGNDVFDVDFSVSANGEFYGSIISQEDLDNGKKINFETYPGLLEGSIKSGKKKGDYLLVLKADKQMDAIFRKQKKEVQVQAVSKKENAWIVWGALVLILVLAYFISKGGGKKKPLDLNDL